MRRHDLGRPCRCRITLRCLETGLDVRDFTPFAEANTAEDTVARLNALFEIVVPAVVDAGGHVNKFLGDGALAVFARPTILRIMPTPP
jgi:hypothetical protein